MKIIFLDIDGVLNSQLYHESSASARILPRIRKSKTKEQFVPAVDKQWLSSQSRFEYKTDDIDAKAVSFLNDLITATSAKVVVSSTWRRTETIESLTKILKFKGFIGEIIDFTPRLNKPCLRGNEIYEWIQTNEKLLGISYYKFNSYVILDDDTDMLLWQKDNFLKIDGYVGLTPTNVYKATWILNKE